MKAWFASIWRRMFSVPQQECAAIKRIRRRILAETRGIHFPPHLSVDSDEYDEIERELRALVGLPLTDPNYPLPHLYIGGTRIIRMPGPLVID